MNKDDMNELKKENDNIEVPPEVDLAIERGIKKGKAYKRKRGLRPIAVLAASLVLALGITSVVKFISKSDTPPLISLNSSVTLPSVGSSENLQKLLKNYIGQNSGMIYDDAVRSSAPASPPMPHTSSAAKGSFSGTETSISDSNSTQGNAYNNSPRLFSNQSRLKE